MSLDFLAGCVGGAAGVIVGHPLDTVKVRLQIQSSDNPIYRGTFHCLQTTVKKEGVRGLYKGISSPLLGVAGVNALIFGVYGSLRPYVHGEPGRNALWAHFIAGSASGAVQSFIASPMELVKTRMQLNTSLESPSISGKQASAMEVLRSICKTEGGIFRGIMKGWTVTLAREVPGFGTYFATYEALTAKSGREVGTFEMMMAGGLAGVASWIVTFPIDVVKTRLQSDTTGQYQGAIDCFRKTLQTEGLSAFSRGLVSTVIRAFPTNAATFTVVTWIMKLADGNNQGRSDSAQDYMREILSEAERLQKALDVPFRLPVYQYFCNGSDFTQGSSTCSVSLSCLNKVAKHGRILRKSFHFPTAALNDEVESSKENGQFQTRESRDLTEIPSSTTELSQDVELLPLRVVDNVDQAFKENCQRSAQVRPSSSLMDEETGTMQIIECLIGSDLLFKLRSFILHLVNNIVPAIKLCSCWDDNCVCFN